MPKTLGIRKWGCQKREDAHATVTLACIAVDIVTQAEQLKENGKGKVEGQADYPLL